MFDHGIVKSYSPNDRYGFITPDGEEKEDLFFHKSSILTEDQNIDKDQRVSYKVRKTEKGLEAFDVKPLDEGFYPIDENKL